MPHGTHPLFDDPDVIAIPAVYEPFIALSRQRYHLLNLLRTIATVEVRLQPLTSRLTNLRAQVNGDRIAENEMREVLEQAEKDFGTQAPHEVLPTIESLVAAQERVAQRSRLLEVAQQDCDTTELDLRQLWTQAGNLDRRIAEDEAVLSGENAPEKWDEEADLLRLRTTMSQLVLDEESVIAVANAVTESAASFDGDALEAEDVVTLTAILARLDRLERLVPRIEALEARAEWLDPEVKRIRQREFGALETRAADLT